MGRHSKARGAVCFNLNAACGDCPPSGTPIEKFAIARRSNDRDVEVHYAGRARRGGCCSGL